MKGKKNVSVERVLDLTNRILESSPNGSKELCLLVEQILHDTGNYHGYNHWYWARQGYSEWKSAGEPTEDKNRFYGPEWKRIYFKN
jgi:hypothetical protein